MAERFVDLDRVIQGEVIQASAAKLGRSPAVLEKDIWICWVLDALFTMPGRVRMAFKGGTSLSKVYGAIHRFSEDVDVTLDYRALAAGIDPFAPGVSKTKVKKLGTTLKERVKQHTFELVVPHLQRHLVRDLHREADGIQCDELGEKIWIKYDSVVEERAAYMADHVLVELGGRNITEPSEQHLLVPYAAAHVPDLEWPVAAVDVLSPQRTFWEKATLIHAECNRGVLEATPERLSRHWHDLAMLADHAVGARALADMGLLMSVVEHKQVFFYAARAQYETACTASCAWCLMSPWPASCARTSMR